MTTLEWCPSSPRPPLYCFDNVVRPQNMQMVDKALLCFFFYLVYVHKKYGSTVSVYDKCG